MNKLDAGRRNTDLQILLNQVNSPITIILILAAGLSFFLGERSDGLIILVIILISAVLGFLQERGAAGAVRKLLAMVSVDARVLRDGKTVSLPLEQVVPGDIVLLAAGDMVPGDCFLIESRDLFCNEAALTGETFPAEKKCGPPAATGVRLAERSSSLFMGTNIVSGTARAVVVKTGRNTAFGSISQHLRQLQPETEFQKGIRRFGWLLMEVTFVLVLLIFSINIFLHKPVLDSFLFSLAIAVGITPQLLPAVISINLAKGATSMARRRVIVKRLASIENLGSMDILCSDKTGTLTEGKVSIYKSVNHQGEESDEVFRLAYLNAYFESGFVNPLDEAIRQHGPVSTEGMEKTDELPYDFIRKCLTIALHTPGGNWMVTKGAFDQVLERCSTIETKEGRLLSIQDGKQALLDYHHQACQEGYRVIAVARKPLGSEVQRIDKADECEMQFAGMLFLFDPPKADAAVTIRQLKELGVTLKIITGDSVPVAEHLSRQIGISKPVILSGEDLRDMTTDALVNQAVNTHVFAAVEPNQKERILQALKKAGHVVGFIGDGINDAPALHTADVGISVSEAVDVAKEAASIVLLGKDLRVLIDGIQEGRKTFANTLKYIFMATSANFGNMFSMAGSSLFLSFLPLLPKQVLLINLLTDIPEMTIATDAVDESMIRTPRRMDLTFIRKFMIVFGIISSLFDYLTFGALIFWLHADIQQFRTGWLLESIVSASLVVLVIRTAQPFYRSRPGKYLLLATLAVIGLALLIPYSFLAAPLGLVPLPWVFYGWITCIVLAYVVTAEVAKHIFYNRIKMIE